jgi:hypothetical protein
MPTGLSNWVSMIGPKVEIFVEGRDTLLREIGTFEIASVRVNETKRAIVFAFVYGVERCAAMLCNEVALSRLPLRKHIISCVANCCLDGSFRRTNLAFDVVAQLIFLAEACEVVLRSDSLSCGRLPKPLRNHRARLLRAFQKLLESSGIDLLSFINAVSECSGVKLNCLKNVNFDVFISEAPDYVS